MQAEIENDDHICPICLTLFFKPVHLNLCKHRFCLSCIQEATEYTDKKKCPLCRQSFKEADLIPDKELGDFIQSKYPDEIKQKAKSLKQRINYRVKIGNTTKVLQTEHDNKYEWRLYLQPDVDQPPLETYAEKVLVELHPTFKPNKIVYQATQKVQLKRIGWGTFRIDLKIYWKKEFGGYTDLYHDLSFAPKTENILNCKIHKQPIQKSK